MQPFGDSDNSTPRPVLGQHGGTTTKAIIVLGNSIEYSQPRGDDREGGDEEAMPRIFWHSPRLGLRHANRTISLSSHLFLAW
ncbi:hypothetical protein VTH06DRAFT_2202 [Thermothelomyces fergusii]